MAERAEAARSARLLEAAMADPALWGREQVTHIDMSRPRRGLWISRWDKLPGFYVVNGQYCHDLLPGWAYTRREVELEMIPDLRTLAEKGWRPTEATSGLL